MTAKQIGIISVAVAALASAFWLASRRNTALPSEATASRAASHSMVDSDTTRRFVAFEAERRRIDQTVWKTELEAQRHEELFIRLWDELRSTTNWNEVARTVPLAAIKLPITNGLEVVEHGIQRTTFGEAFTSLGRDEWHAQLGKWHGAGYALEQSEWRHRRFEPETNGTPARSTFAVTLNVANEARNERIAIRGDVKVRWRPRSNVDDDPAPDQIEVSEIELLRRSGESPFKYVVARKLTPNPATRSFDPVILHDLNGDGLSDVLLCAVNLAYLNRGGGNFETRPLCTEPIERVHVAVVADVDRDGASDILVSDQNGLLLFSGTADGRFPTAPRRLWQPSELMLNPFTIAAGDIDSDGDLDVWLGQYKLPYNEGQMPTPYYDANDGFPAFLLVNGGDGAFRDATEQAGLAAKRFRRAYTASFIDLDDDRDLDLIVVSDFAGVDVYFNDGKGRFADVTSKVLDEAHAFGMAHTFGDYNLDGRLDFMMIGMNSFTADRLEALGLGPAELPEHQRMRARMAYGNRMYFGAGNRFMQTTISDQIARSGWSWGATTLDFDNDGDSDVYVVNGHKSHASAKDYETQFWTHDIYAASSKHDPVRDLYFRATGARLYGQGQSYGGYEKNRFYLNRTGRSFIEAGHLFDVAMELDCRNVVSDDLDADGKLDLIVTTHEAWPERRFGLHIFHNRTPEAGNWIGFRFRPKKDGPCLMGAKVTLKSSRGTQHRWIVNGDSYRSQHAAVAHFGLGNDQAVESVTIAWPGGMLQHISQPLVNRYHVVQPE